MALALAVVLLALLPASASAARWYLAFGGSLSSGAQAGRGGGYPATLYSRLQGGAPDLLLHRVACRGATTTSVFQARGCGIAGSPLGNAVSFLGLVRGNTALVTLDLGADDVYRCFGSRGVNARCVKRGLSAIDRNLPLILARLRAAAGPGARIAGMTHYDPFLGRWSKGRAGRALALASVPVTRELNAHLRRIYARAGVRVADVEHAFSGTALNARRMRPGAMRRLASAAARLCQLTGACSRRFNPLPNTRGTSTIAELFRLAIGGALPPPPPRPGNTGQFITPCGFSHRAPDDPIVFPNQSGASHSHDFFGNRSTNASSTFESLRAAPTACRRPQDTAAYWVPTLYLNGQPVTPAGSTIYYRDAGKDPAGVRAFPSGLKVIAGNSKATSSQDPGIVSWNCGAGSGIENQVAVPTCPAGRSLRVSIRFPDCWDGRNLDSADHKSHMAYAASMLGRRVCPNSHPVAMPRISFNIRYPTVGGSGVNLSSGPAYTMHADFFNAWEPATLDALVRRCLNADVNCGTS